LGPSNPKSLNRIAKLYVIFITPHLNSRREMVDSIASIPINNSYEQASSDRVACIFLPINPITAHIEIPVQEVFMFSTIGIETMESTISLLEFKWGVLQYFSLQGGLRLE
jgi:hypothetical protein